MQVSFDYGSDLGKISEKEEGRAGETKRRGGGGGGGLQNNELKKKKGGRVARRGYQIYIK